MLKLVSSKSDGELMDAMLKRSAWDILIQAHGHVWRFWNWDLPTAVCATQLLWEKAIEVYYEESLKKKGA